MSRILKFIVNGQNLNKDQNCNFDGIVSGTRDYLQCTFSFDSSWKDMNKVAVFKYLDFVFPTKVISDRCFIPKEALVWRNFHVYVVGQDIKGKRVLTNEIIVNQRVV